jgi:hypothetical protein
MTTLQKNGIWVLPYKMGSLDFSDMAAVRLQIFIMCLPRISALHANCIRVADKIKICMSADLSLDLKLQFKVISSQFFSWEYPFKGIIPWIFRSYFFNLPTPLTVISTQSIPVQFHSTPLRINKWYPLPSTIHGLISANKTSKNHKNW